MVQTITLHPICEKAGLPPLALRLWQFPHVQRQFIRHDALFGIDLAFDADACFHNGFLAAGNQGVPPRQAFAFVEQPVSAGVGQPAEFANIIWRQGNAVRYFFVAVFVITALTGFEVEQFAGGAGEDERASVFIFQLVDTAAATAITQAFPFRFAHVGEGFGFPEGIGGHG